MYIRIIALLMGVRDINSLTITASSDARVLLMEVPMERSQEQLPTLLLQEGFLHLRSRASKL